MQNRSTIANRLTTPQCILASSRRRKRLLALAVGAIPLSLCSWGVANTGLYWNNAVTAGNWAADNWGAAQTGATYTYGPPTAGEDAYITSATNALDVTLNVNTPSLNAVRISDTGAGFDTLSQYIAFDLTTQVEYVGVGTNGGGIHNQSAGTNTYLSALILGNDAQSYGTYNLTGDGNIDVTTTGSASIFGMYVGYNGNGTFNQNGGTVSVQGSSNGNLTLGAAAGSVGYYSLSAGTLSVAAEEEVGSNGYGNFTQSGGEQTIANGLGLGNISGSSGTYLLEGTGSLSITGNVSVGGAGNGTFTQSGGTLTITNELAIGTSTGAGTFLLEGTGSFFANYVELGGDGGNGTLTISGGSMSTGGNVYVYSGSTLNQTGGTLNTGYINQYGGTVSLTGLNAASAGNPAGDAFGYFLSGGTCTINGNVYIAGTSAGANGFGTVSISAGSMAISNSLTIYADGTLVQSGGTFSAQSMSELGGSVSLTNLTADSVANSSANVVGSCSISSGTITVSGNEFAANYGVGTISQTGGVQSVTGNLYVAGQSGSTGNYILSAGSLAVSGGLAIANLGTGSFTLSSTGSLTVGGAEYVGLSGNGTFTQNNGTQSIGTTSSAEPLQIGDFANYTGIYNLVGGSLTVSGSEYVGNSGAGTFTQSGGTHTVGTQGTSQALYIGTATHSVGTYTLNGAGALYVPNGAIYVGNSGNGTINQSAGTVALSNLQYGDLNLGNNSTGAGSYTLSGTAFLSAQAGETIGVLGTGSFNQSGGTNTAGNLIVGSGESGEESGVGTYVLSGGTLAVASAGLEQISYGGSGTFNQTGGVQTIGTPGSAGELDIAVLAGGTGTYSLSNAASLTVDGNAYVGGSSSGAGGIGTLSIQGGSTFVTGTLKIWGTGQNQAIFNGGDLSVGTIDDSGVQNNFDWLEGNLTVTGSAGLTIAPTGLFSGLSIMTVASSLTVTNTLALAGGNVVQDASTVNCGTLDVDATSGSSTYFLGGGTLTVNGNEYAGNNGAGSFDQTGGVQAVFGGLYVAGQSGSTGTYTLSAGSLAVGGSMAIGNNGPASFALSGTASLNVLGAEYVGLGGNGTLTQSGGVNTIGTTASNQPLNIGDDSGVAGNYSLTSGTATVNGNVYVGGGSTNGAGGTGTLAISGGSMLMTGEMTVYNGSTLAQSGGSLAIGSGLINDGTTTLTGGTFGPTTIDGTGLLTVSSPGSLTAIHIRQSSLTIGSSSTVTLVDSLAGPGNTSSTSVLTDLYNSGTLNLKNNDLIITDASQFSSVQAAITNAYNTGLWNKPGITSSSAAMHPNAYGLGYATAGAVGTTSFDGRSVSSGTVLVKYTLLGDALLNGTVGLGDFNRVQANLNTGTLWTQAAFHPGATTGLADYNAVIANFNQSPSGSLAGTVKSSIHTEAISAPGAASDLSLGVNTASGDVYALASAATSITGYDIYDKSANFLDSGDPNTDLNERLLSQPSSAATGNQTQFRNVTNYKLWVTILDNTSTLAEGQNNGKLKQGTASTYDTINIPSGGTIDFGDIYNTSTNNKDLTFSFSEADPTNGGNPVTGSTYNAVVTYVGVPEPTTLGVLGLGGLAMMRRRRAPKLTAADSAERAWPA